MKAGFPVWLQISLGAAVLLLLPALFVQGGYGRHLLMLTLILACLGVSLNLVMGYAGLVSVAHGAFFGVGAYATGVLTAGGGSFLLSVLVGIVISAAAGTLLGALTLRLKGHYFALGTLAFTMVAVIVFERWEEVTRGARGISNIPRPGVLASGEVAAFVFTGFWPMYVLVIVLLCLFLAICYLVASSPFGRSLLCIRRNELLGAVYGVDIVSAKLRVFALSAAMASVSGSFYASYIAYIAPADANFMRSFEAIMYVVVGGAGTLWGPVLGAAFVHLVPEFLRGLDDWRLLILGMVLVGIVRFYPAGLTVAIAHGVKLVAARLRGRPGKADAGDQS